MPCFFVFLGFFFHMCSDPRIALARDLKWVADSLPQTPGAHSTQSNSLDKWNNYLLSLSWNFSMERANRKSFRTGLVCLFESCWADSVVSFPDPLPLETYFPPKKFEKWPTVLELTPLFKCWRGLGVLEATKTVQVLERTSSVRGNQDCSSVRED